VGELFVVGSESRGGRAISTPNPPRQNADTTGLIALDLRFRKSIWEVRLYRSKKMDSPCFMCKGGP
jgi:hypothetical protein